MAHTPGPWVVREPEGDELHEIYAEAGGDLICYPVWTANQKANVPLIAAAPDLLAACVEAVSAITYLLLSNDDDDPNYMDTLNTLATAIAKAEGRTDDQ